MNQNRYIEKCVIGILLSTLAFSTVELKIENVDMDMGTLDIYLINTELVGGFQFELSAIEINTVIFMIEDSEMNVYLNTEMVSGFFPASGSISSYEGVLLNIIFSNPTGEKICFGTDPGTNLIVDSDGYLIETTWGPCYDPSCPSDIYDECDVCEGPGPICDGQCIQEGACDCDGNVEDCAGECGGSLFNDNCGICGGDGIANGACDCDGNVLDECGVCNGNGIPINLCDCEGNKYNCEGICGGDVSNCEECENGFYDCSGTCDGSSIEDCAGVCGGSAVEDCAGVCDGDAVEDCAGICDSDTLNDCPECDCADECGGPAEEDECGVCDTDVNNNCIQDCSSVWGGTAWESDCGCVAEGSSGDDCDDCAGTPNGDLELDDCGICDGEGPAEGFGCDGNSLSLFNGLIPEEFSIHIIYPNPFNPITNIIYGLSEHVNVQILVYDLSGQQIETLINEFQPLGYHSINWNASSYPSGVYLIRMDSGDFTQTQKVVLVK